MIKIFLLAFATPELIERAMTDVTSVYDKTLFDVGYPRLNQEVELKALCKAHRWNYQKIENLGCAANWNYVWRFLGKPEILVGVEPDERPSNKSWISRACDCLMEDPALGFVGMGQRHFQTMYDVDPNFKNETFTVGNNTLKNYKTGIGWACGAVSGKFMEKCGMKGDSHYGNLENQTATAMGKLGFRWGLFTDIFSIHICGEPAYETWKVLSADRKTGLSYRDWLLTGSFPSGS